MFDKFSKILMSLFGIGLIFWAGGGIFRMIIAFDIFEPGTVILKNWLTTYEQMQTIILITNLAVYEFSGMLICFLSGMLFFIRERKSVKSQGWIFMTFVLLLIATLCGTYLGWLDYWFTQNVYFWEGKSDKILEKFVFRMTEIYPSVAAGLRSLSLLTIILYIVWRPLSRKEL